MNQIMVLPQSDTEVLLEQIRLGNQQARDLLMQRHRDRLRQMIRFRLDRRLSARLDPSDVVQDTLADATRKLDSYLSKQPLPFYLWLRKLAWERLVMLHRRHLDAGKRSVKLEKKGIDHCDESVMQLVNRLIARESSPSAQLQREENRVVLQCALLQLKEADREILVLRFLEQLSINDIATMLDLSTGAVKLRQLRALDRLRQLMDKAKESS